MLRNSSGTNRVTNAMTCRSGFSALNSSQHLGLAVGGRLEHRQLGRQRRFLERIGLLAGLLRRHIDADDVLAALQQRFQHGLAEGLLAMDHDAHGSTPRHCFGRRGPWAASPVAPDALISAISRGVNFSTLARISSVCSPSSGERFTSVIAVGELDRVADRQVLAARRMIDLDHGAGRRAATAPRRSPSSTGSGRPECRARCTRS